MSQQKTKKQIQDKKVKQWQKQNRAGYKMKRRRKRQYRKTLDIKEMIAKYNK